MMLLFSLKLNANTSTRERGNLVSAEFKKSQSPSVLASDALEGDCVPHLQCIGLGGKQKDIYIIPGHSSHIRMNF